MPEKKRQHYVPKFLIKQFSISQEDKHINLYNINDSKIVDSASLKEQASLSYFYGKEGKRFIPHNKLIAETCIEFFEYAKKFKIGTQYNKDKEYWIYNNEFAAHPIKKNTFTRWLRAFARAARWNYNERSGPQNKFKWFSFSRRLYPPWFSEKG